MAAAKVLLEFPFQSCYYRRWLSNVMSFPSLVSGCDEVLSAAGEHSGEPCVWRHDPELRQRMAAIAAATDKFASWRLV